MPEIALTAQFLDRFAARFGARPAEWHSGVNPRKRARIWTGVTTGEVACVVGARSALFLPFADLGLIVVDEEHEAAYKQDEGGAYQARDMAVMRGRFERAAVVLASATPSIESRVNAESGRYGHLRLKSRHGGRGLPDLAAIDMRKAAPARGRWLSPRLGGGDQRHDRTRRAGLAVPQPARLCAADAVPGLRPPLPVPELHGLAGGASLPTGAGLPPLRPCRAPAGDLPRMRRARRADALRSGRRAARRRGGGAVSRGARPDLSSDFPGGMERLRRELEGVAQGEYDIVIGTQLVAKGHNFPLLSLVGVVDADIGLASGDPRAAERTFQLMQQVVGRAGRGATSGRALLQTWQPDHPVMRALLSGDSERFYREETEQRRHAGLPPFGRLAALIISAKERPAAEAHARALARAAHDLPAAPGWRLARAGAFGGLDEISLLGPAEAPIAVVRGRHRFRLLVRAPRHADMQGFLRAMLAAAPAPRGSVRVMVDVDPYSFL
jgi:primosomal protein N' (replication factor Y)